MAKLTFEITFITLDGNTQTVFVDARSESAAEMEFSRCYEYDEIISTEDVTEYSNEEAAEDVATEETFTLGMTDKDWKTFAAFVATFKTFPIFEMKSDSEGNIEITSKDESFIEKLFNHLS